MTLEEITAIHVIGIMLLVLLIAIVGFICYLMGRYVWRTKYEAPTSAHEVPTKVPTPSYEVHTIIREVPTWIYTRTDTVVEESKPHHNYPHLLVG